MPKSADAPSDTAGLPVRPVQRAYEQVAEQLRDLIVRGTIPAGERLASEGELCESFGVSRSTVREAIRTLASEDLVTTARGASGGTFVAMPKRHLVAQRLSSGLSLLEAVDAVDVGELLDAREVLEAPAVRLAAGNRTDKDLAALAASSVDAVTDVATEVLEMSRDFHDIIFGVAGNRVLHLLARPVFETLRRRRLLPGRATPEFWEKVEADHRRIYDAIAEGDADAAEEAMFEHLRGMRPTYIHPQG